MLEPVVTPRGPCFENLDARMAAVLAAKTGAERLAIADAMFRSTRRMLESHITASHPEWSAGQVAREVASRISHGAF